MQVVHFPLVAQALVGLFADPKLTDLALVNPSLTIFSNDDQMISSNDGMEDLSFGSNDDIAKSQDDLADYEFSYLSISF